MDVKNALRNLIRPFASKYSVIKGIAKGTEDELSLVWSGPPEHLAYFEGRLFSDGTVAASPVGRRPIGMLSRMLSESRSSLAAVVLDRRLANEIKRPEDLVIPLWVDCRVDLDGERKYARSKSLVADLRTIRKYKLDWSVSDSREDLVSFYDRFYYPTIKASHGRAALLADKDERLDQFDSGLLDLLLVRREGKAIAAVTIDYRQQEPVLRDSGVLDGSAKLRKFGVITALNLFSMDYLASQGHLGVGLGLSRSFLDDGVLTFKRKFRPVVRPSFDQCVLVRTGTLNPTTRRILCASHCFTWQGRDLHRTYFEDHASHEPTAGVRANGSDWDFGIDHECFFDVSGETIKRQRDLPELAVVS